MEKVSDYVWSKYGHILGGLELWRYKEIVSNIYSKINSEMQKYPEIPFEKA